MGSTVSNRAHIQERLRSAGAPSASARLASSAASWNRRRRHQRCSVTAARRRRACSAISAASGVCRQGQAVRDLPIGLLCA